jgi:hypothetical protein
MQSSLVHALLAQKEALIQKDPKLASHFVEIDGVPFLPIGSFRNFHMFQGESAHTTFLSSGSTNDSRARHSFSEQGLMHYQKATAAGFRAFLASMNVSPDAMILSLVPTTLEWPQSSLAAMIEMFKQEALNVVYFDPVKELVVADDVVIFGTSIHHIQMRANSAFSGKNVTVIDTGGTKGRTRNYTLGEVHDIIRSTYANAASCKIVSEYGMCELSNQAWSLNAPHDGWFKTNPELTPVIVDLDRRCVIEEDDRVGFLAFVDEGNQESFMAIITEDLALMRSDLPGCFKLIGRAPDASQKGCSLNVKANYVEVDQERLSSPLEKGGRGDFFPDSAWDEYSIRDLELSMASLKDLKRTAVDQTRKGQRVLMVLSANIPITFLYPTFMCALRGVKEVHLLLPSIRVNDPTSERIREQIQSLVEQISPMVQPMQVSLHTNKDVSFSALDTFDAVLVFGSDETLRTFAERVPPTTQLIGLGSIQNAMHLDSKSYSELADICSRWLGRGCLTPVAIVGEGPVDTFAAEFEKNFSARLKAAGAENPFAHRHKLLVIQALYPQARIHRGPNTFIVDLRDCEAISCAAGGCGLVYVISEIQLAQLGLDTYNPEPGFLEEHQGRTWSEWL